MKRHINAKDSSIGIIASFAINIIAVSLFGAIFAFIYEHVNHKPFDLNSFDTNAGLYAIICIVMYLAIFLAFYLVNRRTDNQIISRPSAKKIILYILLGLLLNFTLAPIVNVVDALLDKLNVSSSSLSYELNTKNYLISIFSLAVLPAVFEELLFRGLVLKGLKNRSKSFAIVVSTLAFTLFHLSIRQTVYPILFGLLLGLVMYNENNILYCIVLHFVNNFISLTLSYLNISISINMVIYSIIAVLLLLTYLIVLIRQIRKNSPPKQNKKKDEKIYLTFALSILFVLWLIIGIA